MNGISSFRETRERYPFLRIVASLIYAAGYLLMGLAALTLFVGIGVSVMGLVKPPISSFGFWVSAIWSLGLLASGVQCFALGSFIKLAIHIEENTRASAQALERLLTRANPKPDLDPRSIYLS